MLAAAAAAAAAAARLVDANWSALTTTQFWSAANQYEVGRDSDAGLCRSTSTLLVQLNWVD